MQEFNYKTRLGGEGSSMYREANRAADWLATYGVNLEQHLLIFEPIPVDLQAVLLEDLDGRTIGRIW